MNRSYGRYPQRMGQAPSPAAPQKKLFEDFYVYQTLFASVGPGIADSNNVNIQADADFMLQKLTFFASIAGAAQTDSTRVIPLMDVQIIDSGSGRNLFDSSIDVPQIFGTGELPQILAKPKLFPARSTITVNVSNFSAATTYRLRLAFIGYKVFGTGMA